MNPRRMASIAGTVAVTMIAAVGSYDHMRELALRAGQPALLAVLLPLSVDGMILVATLALGDGRRSRWSAWLAFLVGVAASLAANVIVADPEPVARVVSAWPAVALLLTVEILTRSGRKVPAEDPEPALTAAQSAAQPPEDPDPTPSTEEETKPVRKRRSVAETRRLAEALWAERPNISREETAALLGITPRRLRQVLN